MLLLPLRRLSACHQKEPAKQLPSPGPFPAARPPWRVIGIFLVVLVVVLWLLAHRYSAEAALGVVAGSGAIAAATASRLTSTQTGDG